MKVEEKTAEDDAKMPMAASISFNKLGLATYNDTLPPLDERAPSNFDSHGTIRNYSNLNEYASQMQSRCRSERFHNENDVLIAQMKYLTVSEANDLQIEDLNKMVKIIVFAPNESVKSAILKKHKHYHDELMRSELQKQETDEFIEKFRRANARKEKKLQAQKEKESLEKKVLQQNTSVKTTQIDGKKYHIEQDGSITLISQPNVERMPNEFVNEVEHQTKKAVEVEQSEMLARLALQLQASRMSKAVTKELEEMIVE